MVQVFSAFLLLLCVRGSLGDFTVSIFFHDPACKGAPFMEAILHPGLPLCTPYPCLPVGPTTHVLTSCNKTITKLDLSNCEISTDVAIAMEQGLAGCENLQHLNLSNNKLNEKAIIAIVGQLKGKPISFLDVSGVKITKEGTKHLIDFAGASGCVSMRLILKDCQLDAPDQKRMNDIMNQQNKSGKDYRWIGLNSPFKM